MPVLPVGNARQDALERIPVGLMNSKQRRADLIKSLAETVAALGEPIVQYGEPDTTWDAIDIDIAITVMDVQEKAIEALEAALAASKEEEGGEDGEV